MLNLDDPKWSKLPDSSGNTQNVPVLLKHLMEFPQSSQKFDLWEKLFKGKKVFQSSYAVAPYLLNFAGQALQNDRIFYLLLIGVIETYRLESEPIEPDLEKDYFLALQTALPLIIECLQADFYNDDDMVGIFAAFAAIRGKHQIAERFFELVF